METTQPVIFPKYPEAKTMGDLLLATQITIIYQRAKKADINADERCKEILGCKPEDLSREAASSFILYLELIQQLGDNVAVRIG